MLTPSEEVTKTWIKRKGILIKSRPEPSRFSFVVCLSIVLSIAFGFLGGFITAGLALSENYSSVYESLLVELDNTRHCIEREREQILSMKNDVIRASVIVHRPGEPPPIKTAAGHPHEQVVLSVFNQTLTSFILNNTPGGLWR